MRCDLNLPDKHMTFFVGHSEIDKKHLDEVIETINDWCVTPQQQKDLIEVLKTTLSLTGSILNEAYDQYIQEQLQQKMIEVA